MNKTRRMRIEELESLIRYEKERMGVCAYGHSDILYLESLEIELRELQDEEDKDGYVD
jgi:hypothetical protein